MGPWLRSHGRVNVDSDRVSVDPRFNGAVASQPRKATEPSVMQISGSGFNGAVASQPRKAPGG